MKQCRIIIRRAVKEDKDKVFCNLSGRTVLSHNDKDNEGLLGHPAMVSRPLDFRTIDVKLAAGSYGGSHESFIDEVREVLHNIRTAYSNKSDLLELAGSLLQKFEEDYEKEVLPLVQKIECSNDSSLSSEAAKARDGLLAHVNESSLPKAPWEEDCEAKMSHSQHPSSGSHIIRKCIKRRPHRKLTHKFTEKLSQLTSTMELKEYWELPLEDVRS
ncbi:methyl-CpG-binding domain-containing protein 9-like isoform X3 [Capsicum annuum]|uniref:methyl-CpG-binding domain-containing protein 9-like isoform X3 n=1 Tax=Capsicum annuum TaxID=4072 RepID=UPI001FB1534C|nr:methyl-CpG-binding domain-containing protein 9-like isoform X3 [Capsicum annuum]